MSPISESDLLRLAEIVREETGNQVLRKNHSMLTARIQSRLLKLNLADMAGYWRHFSKNEEMERDVLRGLMTTHYTFFFREYTHFEVLADWIEKEQARLKKRYAETQQKVRIWSAACSRGHEVYSLAAFLTVHLENRYGIPFEILGTDIDKDSVAYAKNGVYPLKEVNTIPKLYLDGFWKKGTGNVSEFASAHPNVREKVRFDQLNLFDLSQWKEPGAFDVLFCRNVFIYFSEENVHKVALGLAKRMQPAGLFVAGVSEPIRFDSWKYPSVGPSCYLMQNSLAQPVAPKAIPAIEAAAQKASTQQVAPTAKKQYRVLCVDDSPTIQSLMKAIFNKDPDCAGVEVAGNGRIAREKLDQGSFDLITLDIHMPEVNGIEFLERFYQRKKDPPVIMVSSVNRSDMELAHKAISLGAIDYVEKPSMAELKKCAEEIVMKTKLALRSSVAAPETPVGEFDEAFKQKIVVPDASLCLRMVFVDASSTESLEQVVRGQTSELRSPPLLIVEIQAEEQKGFTSSVLQWTERKIARYRQGGQLLRPNEIYMCRADDLEAVMNTNQFKTVSVQLLSNQTVKLNDYFSKVKTQVLLDEKHLPSLDHVARSSKLKIADVTPATSFPSLSVEFFANVRKAG